MVQLEWNTNGITFFYANVNRLVSDKRREEFVHYLNTLKSGLSTRTFRIDTTPILIIDEIPSPKMITRTQNRKKRADSPGIVNRHVAFLQKSHADDP